MIDVFLVDDRLLFKEGLICLLEATKNINVLFQAENSEDALLIIKQFRPPVTLINFFMGDLFGFEILRKMASRTKLIVLLKNYHHGLALRALRLGALGILTQNASFSDLVQAIESVYADRPYLSQGLAHNILFDNLNFDKISKSPLDTLSNREFQIMMMIVSGYSVQYISSRLFLSTKTVNTYRYRIFQKFSLNNDVELTHLAWFAGLFLPDPILRSRLR